VDPLLIAFVASALAEVGDKTQLLVIALAARYRRPGAVLLGVAVAALANTMIAAFGGTLVNGIVTLRAISLLVAVALIYTGVASLIPQKTESDEQLGSTWKSNAFLTSAICFFLLEFGDKTQFITFGIAAQFDSLWLAAAGATAGVLAANAPAALIGDAARDRLRSRAVRLPIAFLFLLVGFVIAVNALRIV
jgi:putative Ca2+/H+ antiporter (TMEM165/GDT1 family)